MRSIKFVLMLSISMYVSTGLFSSGKAAAATLQMYVSPASSSQVNLFWPSSSKGLLFYDIFRNGVSIKRQSENYYSDRGLTAGTRYCYQVRRKAVSILGSGTTEEICVMTPASGIGDIKPPTTPTHVVVTTVSSEQDKLSWQASTDNKKVVGYEIIRNEKYIGYNAGRIWRGVFTPPITRYSDTQANTVGNCYQVRSYDSSLNRSEPSLKVCDWPPTPDSVTSRTLSESSIKLSWNQSTPVAGFGIYRNGVLIPNPSLTNRTVSGGARDYTDTGLTALTEYCYSIDAVSAAGRRSPQTEPACTKTVGFKWPPYVTGGPIYSSPAIGNDDTVYIASADNKLYAIKSDGTLKWAYTTDHYITASPAVGSDGTIYIGSWDGHVYAINPDGTTKWPSPYPPLGDRSSPVTGTPAIGSDGTIYASFVLGYNESTTSSVGSGLYAIKPDGSRKWPHFTAMGESRLTSPVIGSDGTIYVGSSAGKLYAINSDNGNVKWTYDSSGRSFRFPPAIGSDGTIYAGSENRMLYAINPDGTMKWAYDTGGAVSSPSIAGDGSLYVVSQDSYCGLYVGAPTSLSSDIRAVCKINPDGTLNRVMAGGTGAAETSIPSIASDGSSYVGSANNILLAINPDGTRKWIYMGEGGNGNSSSAIGSDGTVYIGSSDGKLYALKGAASLADAPWPMFQHDLQHTGRK